MNGCMACGGRIIGHKGCLYWCSRICKGRVLRNFAYGKTLENLEYWDWLESGNYQNIDLAHSNAFIRKEANLIWREKQNEKNISDNTDSTSGE